ncbi:MAG: cellulase N-terminal Ig-like domain-containing protein [Flavitalea sp.]
MMVTSRVHYFLLVNVFFIVHISVAQTPDSAWIRINQPGYFINSSKVAVWVSKTQNAPCDSGLAVYHNDGKDNTTNEPTMEGTASLIYLLAETESESKILKTK